jgi:hypothetical protein
MKGGMKMARFKGTVKGGRGETARLGHANTGLVTTTNGWDTGVKVYASVDKDGNDRFDVYLTGGSNEARPTQLVGSYGVDDFPTWAQSRQKAG